MSQPEWEWWLVNSSDLSEIAPLNMHQRQIQVQLNNQGKASGWLHLLDPLSEYVVEHQTGLKCVRNGQVVYSGEIWQANENSSASGVGQQQGQDQLQITSFGWLNALGTNGQTGRLVHTGAEFQAMLYVNGVDSSGGYMPNYAAWRAANGGDYVQVGIDEATTLAYDAVQYPTTTDAAIIFDLLNRANIDSPTLMTPGNVYGTPIQRNLTLQRLQMVGQEVIQLCNVESGVDLHIDPVTRIMDLYGPGASSSPLIANGRGVDRGQETLFTYPGNCVSASRSGDGTMTCNRMEAVGQYDVGRADDLISQQENGLHEQTQSLSEVVDPNILVAYAQSEVAVLKNPWTVITVTPRGVLDSDSKARGVPQPWDDYDLGDIIYCRIQRGPRFQVGVGTPQPLRMFGWTVSISDDGVEKVSSISTTYQGLGNQ